MSSANDESAANFEDTNRLDSPEEPLEFMFGQVVYNAPSPCAYLPGRLAVNPLRYVPELSPEQFELMLEAGDRRAGMYFYRTACPGCRACEAIRVPVDEFLPNRTMQRTLKRGRALLESRVARPSVDEARVELFNRHKTLRGLDRGDGPIDRDSYVDYLIDSVVETLEFTDYFEGKLVSTAISDRSAHSLNAVYCHYDPEFRRLGLGTYNVLRQIEYCRDNGLKYLYLGYYVVGSPAMLYKGNFRPHERLIEGMWQRFEKE